MQIQHGLKKETFLRKYFLGAHPIIQHYMDMLKVSEIIGSYVPSDKRKKLETEDVLSLVIHNILTAPSSLYEFQDWLKPIDLNAINYDERFNDHIYDERIGRDLEAFYDCRNHDVFFKLALNAIEIYDLDCSQIHQDTTTITFSGKYLNWGAHEKIDYGHNKDHRPDLKQLVLGLSVTSDGAVPISHRIYNGNQSDDTLHVANHKNLQKLLSCTDFIYVADCKLATEKNLEKISSCEGRFVTVMPRTWKEDSEFRKSVTNDPIEWELLLEKTNNRKPNHIIDHYYVAKGDYKTKHDYTLHWIKSTQKQKQDIETRERRLQKSIDQLKLMQTKLNKYNLKTQIQIKNKIELILKENKCQELITFQINSNELYKKSFNKPGRPTDDSEPQLVRKITYSISFSKNEFAIEQQEKTDGIFPLITNLDRNEYNAKRVLEIYKFQPFIEKRYSQLKTYQEVAPVFLKKGERIVAFLHLQVIALMISALIERKIRLAMKKNNITELPIYPEQRKCKAPTMHEIVRLFQGVEHFEVEQNGTTTIFPAELDSRQKKVLELLEVPLNLYQ